MAAVASEVRIGRVQLGRLEPSLGPRIWEDVEGSGCGRSTVVRYRARGTAQPIIVTIMDNKDYILGSPKP